jgi:HEAT repeat protein
MVIGRWGMLAVVAACIGLLNSSKAETAWAAAPAKEEVLYGHDLGVKDAVDQAQRIVVATVIGTTANPPPGDRASEGYLECKTLAEVERILKGDPPPKPFVVEYYLYSDRTGEATPTEKQSLLFFFTVFEGFAEGPKYSLSKILPATAANRKAVELVMAGEPVPGPGREAAAAEVARRLKSVRESPWGADYRVVESIAALGGSATESLVAALGDGDASIRIKAARALGKIGDKRAVEPLIALLRKENREREKTAGEVEWYGLFRQTSVRYAVVEALGAIARNRAERLLETLKDKDPAVREGIALALGKTLDPKAVEPLIAALKDPDARTRTAAAIGLEYLRDPRVFEPLVAMLRAEKREDLKNTPGEIGRIRPLARMAAAHALAATCGKASQPLLTLLKDEDASVREAAAFALGVFHPDTGPEALLAVMKEDKAPYVRAAAAAALGGISNHHLDDEQAAFMHFSDDHDIQPYQVTIEPFLAALKDPDPRVRHVAVSRLANMDDPRIEDGCKGLVKDPDAQVRSGAIYILCDIEGDKALDVALAAIKDPEWTIRQTACLALGSMADRRAVDPLIEALQKDKDPQVRYAAATALAGNQNYGTRRHSPTERKGFVQSDKAVDALIGAMKDPDTTVRSGAVYALKEAKSARAFDAEIAALKDPEPDVRAGAIAMLRDLKDPRAFDSLVTVLKDKQEPEGRPEPMGGFMAFRVGNRCMAAWALASLGDARAVEPLLAALKDDSRELRAAAAVALSTFKEERVIDAVAACLHDGNEEVRLGAARGLLQMGDRARKLVEQAAAEDPSPEVRDSAKRILEEPRS